MDIAVLISGYFRSFKLNIDNFKECFLKTGNKVDMYVHYTKNELANDKYINNSQNALKLIKNELDPVVLLSEPDIDYSDNKNINSLINNKLKYYKLNELKKINENIRGKKYDIVVRYRPDTFFLEESEVLSHYSSEHITLPIDSKIDKVKLLHDTDPYISDIFAYGPSKLMDKYFEIFLDIKRLIGEYGIVPETLLYYHLTNNNIAYNHCNIKFDIVLSQCNTFAICGDSGSGKTTLGAILKTYFNNSFILECDRYHKWERNDENWKTYTHLNPEANYILKMEDDIFNLKIGNKIYQVDYDHEKGKFTDKNEIDACENIIVCGLHNFYTKNNNVYNLKIYLDTDDNLRIPWKIERDMAKRGYSKEKIMNQIQGRKEDYVKYIQPQKNKSDIIIRFFKNGNHVSLDISVNNNHSISSLSHRLKEIDVEYKIVPGDEFTCFTFDRYTYNERLFDTINPHFHYQKNLYDYILFFIFSLYLSV